MNKQPYSLPPRWWAPKLSPRWVRMTRSYRLWKLRREQRLVGIEVAGEQHLRAALAADCGVMIAANHAAHHDSAALYVAADRIDQPLYFLTAWQVFGMSYPWQRWAMQRLGCFSIDREGSDRQAFKQAVQILQSEPHPLVIFPEGDIYHVTDQVMPFREGAAAIALAAARRARRPVAVVPCAIKFWYVADPTPQLEQLMQRLESRLFLRPQPGLSLAERIYRFAEAVLALQEMNYLSRVQSGPLPARINGLADAVLAEMEGRYGGRRGAHDIPGRVKDLRQQVIARLRQQEGKQPQEEDVDASAETAALVEDMNRLFFATQLFSYPGDYVRRRPTVERLAETLDKFEEDILEQEYPGVRGTRRVTIQFGEAIPVSTATDRRGQISELTHIMRERVQAILDQWSDSADAVVDEPRVAVPDGSQVGR